MNTMSYKGFAAAIGFDGDDMIFTGRIAAIDDVIGFHSDTVGGLQEAFHEAVDDYLDTCRKVGKSPDKPFSGKLMLRVHPQVHSMAAMAAQLSGQSMNAWGEDALRSAARRILPQELHIPSGRESA